jgi:hypothetical protein
MSTERLLARSQVLTHPSGLRITTPILVPSFSSKGFPSARSGKTWVARALEITSEWLTGSMLISAYDIFHKNIPSPTRLLCTPEVTLLDSGGYEAGFDEDLSTVAVKNHRPKAWSLRNLRTVLDAWPDRFAAVFTSYDHPARRVPLSVQIREARELFDRYPKQMHSLLLKPGRGQQHLGPILTKVTARPNVLAGFDVIGVTEKELGDSMLDRMQRIAELRLGLDQVGNAAPIQVFGALDPLSSCLYFIAGAEIFDGLTWLRYAYLDGMCVYRANYGARSLGLSLRDILVDWKTMVDNVNYLQGMELSMKRVAHDNEIEHFSHHVELLRRGFADLRARLDGRI